MIRHFILIFILGLATPVFAAATPVKKGPQSLGKFGAWVAYSLTENGQMVCYMSLTTPPPAKADKKKKRGASVLMITHRPTENNLNVVSYAAGEKFKPASSANVRVETKTFNLFTQGDTAWSRDAGTDRALAKAIRHGTMFSLTGTSAKDEPLTASIPLKGAAEAYVAIGKACGIPVEEPKKPASTKPVKPAVPKKQTEKKPAPTAKP